MATNQLDLNIVMGGFSKANDTLSLLRGSLTNVRQSMVDFQATTDRLTMAQSIQRKANEKLTGSIKESVSDINDLAEAEINTAESTQQLAQAKERLRLANIEALASISS